MSEKITPLPWDYVPSTEHHGPYITSDHGGTIADLYFMSEPGTLSTASGGTSKPISFFYEMADPNAAFIVRAVNAHDDLVSAVTGLLALLDDGTCTADPEESEIAFARAALAQVKQP